MGVFGAIGKALGKMPGAGAMGGALAKAPGVGKVGGALGMPGMAKPAAAPAPSLAAKPDLSAGGDLAADLRQANPAGIGKGGGMAALKKLAKARSMSGGRR